MSNLFIQLNKFEEKGKITLGVNRNHANNFFYQRKTFGKILNWITNLSPIGIIIIFIKLGIIEGLASIIALLLYVSLIQKIASNFTRKELLKDEALFSAAYQASSIHIRINSTGEIVRYPEDWKDFTNYL